MTSWILINRFFFVIFSKIVFISFMIYSPLFIELQVGDSEMHSQMPLIQAEFGSLIWHSNDEIHDFPKDTGFRC